MGTFYVVSYLPVECGAGAFFTQRIVFSGHHVWRCDTSYQLWLGRQRVLHWLSSPAWKEELGGTYQCRSSLPWQDHWLTYQPVVHLQWLQVSYIQSFNWSGLFFSWGLFFLLLLFSFCCCCCCCRRRRRRRRLLSCFPLLYVFWQSSLFVSLCFLSFISHSCFHMTSFLTCFLPSSSHYYSFWTFFL